MTGYTTSDLPNAPLADEVIVNRNGSTGRQPVADLATQLAGSGPLAEQLDELRLLASDEPRQLLPADMATTAAIALTGAQTIDGIATGTGKRVLVKDQSDATQNGIWITSATGAWTRAADLDAAAEFAHASVYVTAGTVHRGTTWMQIAAVSTVGTSAVTWRKIKDEAGLQALIDAQSATVTDTSLRTQGISQSGTAAEYDGNGIALRRWGPSGEMIVSGEVYAAGGKLAALPTDVAVINGASPAEIAADGVMPFCIDGQGRLVAYPHPMLARAVQALAPTVVDTDQIVSRRNIVIYSDSMAAAGSGWGADLATLMSDRFVTVRGVGGQTSRSIGQRQGGIPISLAAATIPASGAVNITTTDSANPFNYSASFEVTIAGVIGTLTTSATLPWSFTRASAGTSVSVASGSGMTITTSEADRVLTQVLVSGRNDFSGLSEGSDATLQGIVDRNVAMLGYLTPRSPHALVIGVTTSSDQRTDGTSAQIEARRRIIRYNELMRDGVGLGRFIDLQDYMVNRALAEAVALGLASSITTDDASAIAAGTIPGQLLADPTHYSTLGKQMAARHIKRCIIGRGF